LRKKAKRCGDDLELFCKGEIDGASVYWNMRFIRNNLGHKHKILQMHMTLSLFVNKELVSWHFWRAPKSRGETHLRVPQSQVAESWNLEARSRLPTLKRGRGSSWEPKD
jgi:hypothetical protein